MCKKCRIMNAKEDIFQINKIPFLAIFRKIVNIHCNGNERTSTLEKKKFISHSMREKKVETMIVKTMREEKKTFMCFPETEEELGILRVH